MKRLPLLLGLFLPALIGGCDVADLMPTTAAEAGKASARVAVVMQAFHADTMESQVEAFEMTVVDVLLHRVEDDAWIIANDGVGQLRADDADGSLAFTGLPIGLGNYDRVLVALDGARVSVQGEWIEVALTDTELEVPHHWIVNDETQLDLGLDLQQALAGSDGRWVLTPRFTVSAGPTP